MLTPHLLGEDQGCLDVFKAAGGEEELGSLEVIAMQRCRPFDGGSEWKESKQSATNCFPLWEASCAKADTNSFVEFDDELERFIQRVQPEPFKKLLKF